jgi:hypothetical protein
MNVLLQLLQPACTHTTRLMRENQSSLYVNSLQHGEITCQLKGAEVKSKYL